MLSQQGEDWRSVRCMCGALSGRCQDYVTESGEANVVYRLLKYAIRPVSPYAEYVSYFHGLVVSWLISVCILGRVGYRFLLSLSKIWQNSPALMQRTGLSFWMRKKSVLGSLYVPPACFESIHGHYSFPLYQKMVDVALQTEYAFVLQG
jgi:hypothetical protein